MIANTSNDYKKLAHEVFQTLRVKFEEYTIFWRLGHSLDTMIDYLAINPADAIGFTEIALKKYLDRQSLVWNDKDEAKEPWWYDDYAWWAIAGLKASQHPEIFGTYAYCFRGISNICWQAIYRNAPNVWKNADHDRFGEYKPRFEGGVWNYFFSNKPIFEIRYTPCWPGWNNNPFVCMQNTVTNGLYWVLASRLYHITGDSSYKKAADTEYEFLNNWFNVTEPDKSLLYYYNTNDRSKFLVRERVSTYSDTNSPVYGYDEQMAWLGDQGLILGGLVDMMRCMGNDSPKNNEEYKKLLKMAKAITDGVKEKMCKDGLLLPWISKNNSPPGNDKDDYMTGIGVYMRYLLYAYQNNDDLKNYLKDTCYPDLVRKNADEVKGNLGTDLIELTNNLAILVTAISMSD